MTTHPDLEENLFRLLKTIGRIPLPARQVRVVPDRKWTFDFAWSDHKLAIEIEGGIWMKGRTGHSSASGIDRDIQKNNAGILLGWRCLRYSSKDLKERPVQVVEEIEQAYCLFQPGAPK